LKESREQSSGRMDKLTEGRTDRETELSYTLGQIRQVKKLFRLECEKPTERTNSAWDEEFKYEIKSRSS